MELRLRPIEIYSWQPEDEEVSQFVRCACELTGLRDHENLRLQETLSTHSARGRIAAGYLRRRGEQPSVHMFEL